MVWFSISRGAFVTRHGTLHAYNRQGCRCDICVSSYREYTREYYKRNTIGASRKIGNRLRSRISNAIRSRGNVKKSGSAVRDLGCSMDEFILYLESKFLDGMTWNNYGNKVGEWSIDHVKPLCIFDLTDRNQFLEACHYTNMRPLWHIDNIRRPKDGSDIQEVRGS